MTYARSVARNARLSFQSAAPNERRMRRRVSPRVIASSRWDDAGTTFPWTTRGGDYETKTIPCTDWKSCFHRRVVVRGEVFTINGHALQRTQFSVLVDERRRRTVFVRALRRSALTAPPRRSIDSRIRLVRRHRNAPNTRVTNAHCRGARSSADGIIDVESRSVRIESYTNNVF